MKRSQRINDYVCSSKADFLKCGSVSTVFILDKCFWAEDLHLVEEVVNVNTSLKVAFNVHTVAVEFGSTHSEVVVAVSQYTLVD